MTTDAFTEAAFESAASKYQGDWDPFEQDPVDDYGLSESERQAHIAGWKAARAHLAQQEPTDAEVLAALNADYALRFGPSNLPADSLEPYGDKHVQIMRAALVAAKEARHATDE